MNSHSNHLERDKAILAIKHPEIKSREKLILFALNSYSNSNGTAFPKVDRLVEELRMKRETIFRGLSVLKETGLIKVSKMRGEGVRFHNQYDLKPLLNRAPNDTVKLED